MQDDGKQAPDDGDDVEGHAFKWGTEDDGKGGKRLRQGWDPDSPPPGRPDRPRQPEQPKQPKGA